MEPTWHHLYASEGRGGRGLVDDILDTAGGFIQTTHKVMIDMPVKELSRRMSQAEASAKGAGRRVKKALSGSATSAGAGAATPHAPTARLQRAWYGKVLISLSVEPMPTVQPIPHKLLTRKLPALVEVPQHVVLHALVGFI